MVCWVNGRERERAEEKNNFDFVGGVINSINSICWINSISYILFVKISLFSMSRHDLCLEEKINLIKDKENGLSHRQLSEGFKVSIDDVSNILKRKSEYIDDYQLNRNKIKKFLCVPPLIWSPRLSERFWKVPTVFTIARFYCMFNEIIGYNTSRNRWVWLVIDSQIEWMLSIRITSLSLQVTNHLWLIKTKNIIIIFINISVYRWCWKKFPNNK